MVDYHMYGIKIALSIDKVCILIKVLMVLAFDLGDLGNKS